MTRKNWQAITVKRLATLHINQAMNKDDLATLPDDERILTRAEAARLIPIVRAEARRGTPQG